MESNHILAPNIKLAIKVLILLGVAAVMNAAALDAVWGVEKPATKAVEREVIPGADRMTGAERETYRRRMEAASSPAEKAKIRAEYDKAAKTGKTTVEAAPPAPLVGDPARGAALHGGCFSCHGIERYTAPITYAAASFMDSLLRASGLSDLPPAEPTRFKGRIQSLQALRAGLTRRNDYLNPKMTPQEVEDVVAYLNVTYYKFPQ